MYMRLLLMHWNDFLSNTPQLSCKLQNLIIDYIIHPQDYFIYLSLKLGDST